MLSERDGLRKMQKNGLRVSGILRICFLIREVCLPGSAGSLFRMVRAAWRGREGVYGCMYGHGFCVEREERVRGGR